MSEQESVPAEETPVDQDPGTDGDDQEASELPEDDDSE